MTFAVVDENVPIVANDAARLAGRLKLISPQADDACRLATIERLQMLIRGGVILIDDYGIVLGKYRDKLSSKGQPGIGDAFLRHIWDNSWNPKKVLQLAIEREKSGEFTAFPDDPDLETFDKDDRIFVALARTAPKKAIIVNAVDSDYRDHSIALTRFGIEIEELCPHCLRKKARLQKSK